MSGPDGVKVPPQHQAVLGKTVENLVDDTYQVSLVGTQVRASGNVKNIADGWTEFSKSDNTGHFAPIILPLELVGQKVTLSGRTGEDRKVTITEDRLLIVRLENLDGNVLTVKDESGESVIMTIDFSGVTKQEE